MLFKVAIDLKILKNSRAYVYREKLFVYKTVKCEVINVVFLSREIVLNENVLNYYIHQKECAGLTVNQKFDPFEIIPFSLYCIQLIF